MNLICSIDGDPYTVSALMEIIKHYKPNKVHIVASSNWFKKISDFGVSYTDLYCAEPCSRKLYKDNIYYDDLIPVTSDLLEQFAPYYDAAFNIIVRDYDLNPPSVHFINQEILRHIEYWNTVLIKSNIDLLILRALPFKQYNYILYALCKIKKIPTLFQYWSPLNGYAYLLQDVDHSAHEIEHIYRQLQTEHKDTNDIPLPDLYLSFFNTYLNRKHSDIIQDYMRNYKPEYKLWTNIRFVLKCVKNCQFRNIFPAIKKSFFTSLYWKKWRKVCQIPDINKKYVYVPLHNQPGKETCPSGGYYHNQELIIKLLSSVLPDNVYIYVKENPKQTIWFRSLDYPGKLAEIPRVVLVPCETNSAMLIEKCLAVAACTGTALLEGIFKGKPGLMFGNFIIQYAPLIFHIKTFDDTKSAVANILNNNFSYSEKELKLFLLALSKVCFMSRFFKTSSPIPSYWNKEQATSEIKNAYITAINKLGFKPPTGDSNAY